jgi:hypothetical protein
MGRSADKGAPTIAPLEAGVDLADAGDAGVGGDFDDEGVLAAVALFLDLGQAEVDGFYVGDFHG